VLWRTAAKGVFAIVAVGAYVPTPLEPALNRRFVRLKGRRRGQRKTKGSSRPNSAWSS
jgi:hypothetical protein